MPIKKLPTMKKKNYKNLLKRRRISTFVTSCCLILMSSLKLPVVPLPLTAANTQQLMLANLTLCTEVKSTTHGLWLWRHVSFMSPVDFIACLHSPLILSISGEEDDNFRNSKETHF